MKNIVLSFPQILDLVAPGMAPPCQASVMIQQSVLILQTNVNALKAQENSALTVYGLQPMVFNIVTGPLYAVTLGQYPNV